MYVEVKGAQNGSDVVALRNVEDLTRFSVHVPKNSSAELVSRWLTQSGAGRLEGDEVAVNVEWIRRQTGSRSEEWHGSFERMLAYAATRGWIDPAGEAVLAHVERV